MTVLTPATIRNTDIAGLPAVEHEPSSNGAVALARIARKYCLQISVAAGQSIKTNGGIYFVENGFVLATKYLSNGKRQNVSVFLSGDLFNHEVVSLGLERASSEYRSVTKCKLLYVDKRTLTNLLNANPVYWRHFIRFVAFQELLMQEWLLNIGQRNTEERTAHFLCEMRERMRTVNAAPQSDFFLPLRQLDLADILGMSIVQQNRSLGKLKQRKLVDMKKKHVTVLDWDGLAEIARFDRSYLDAAITTATNLTGPAVEPG